MLMILSLIKVTRREDGDGVHDLLLEIDGITRRAAAVTALYEYTWVP